MEDRKRERSSNYTSQEVSLLIELCCKHKSIIASKDIDKDTNRKKDATWKKIASDFNSQSCEEPRSVKTLRLKYEALKKNLKKKSVESLTPDEEKLIAPLNDGDESEPKVIYPVFTETGEEKYDMTMYSTDDVDQKMVLPICSMSDRNGSEDRIDSNECSDKDWTIPSSVPSDRRTRSLKKRRKSDQKSLRNTLSKVLNTNNEENTASKSDVTALEHTIALERLEQQRQLFEITKQNTANEERRRDEELEMKRIEHRLRIDHMLNEETRRNEEHDMRMRQVKEPGAHVNVWQ